MRNKKKIHLLIIFLLLIALCCSCALKAIMSVSDDSFSLTPDEFIANLNAVIEEQNDSRYWTIPPYTESGRDIDISGSNFSLRLDVNNHGKITAIRWDWKASKQGVNRQSPVLPYRNHLHD